MEAQIIDFVAWKFSRKPRSSEVYSVMDIFVRHEALPVVVEPAAFGLDLRLRIPTNEPSRGALPPADEWEADIRTRAHSENDPLVFTLTGYAYANLTGSEVGIEMRPKTEEDRKDYFAYLGAPNASIEVVVLRRGREDRCFTRVES